MNEIQKKHGPWAQKSGFAGCPDITKWCTVADQLPRIKEATDVEWLRAVMTDKDTGVTVRRAAERRLRAIYKSGQAYKSP